MPTLAYNKRAQFDYTILEAFEGGLVLSGREVKAVRAGQISLRGAFVTIHNNEALLTNATISAWQPNNNLDDYNPTRPRKVLLKKSELKQLVGKHGSKGLTMVPIRVYTKRSRIKIEVALVRGKKAYNKKEAKREQDIQRDVDRLLRGKE